MPLETPYTEVADRVCEQVSRLPLARNATLAVDATGVGLPVIDYLRARRPPARLVPIVITGPGRVNSHKGIWTVPRADLIANLQVLVETNKLRVAAGTRDAAQLRAELSNFSDQRIGHYDLVFATALALFPAVRFRSKPALVSRCRTPAIWQNDLDCDVGRAWKCGSGRLIGTLAIRFASQPARCVDGGLRERRARRPENLIY